MFWAKDMHFHRIAPTTEAGIYQNTPTPGGTPPMFSLTIVHHNYFFYICNTTSKHRIYEKIVHFHVGCRHHLPIR